MSLFNLQNKTNAPANNAAATIRTLCTEQSSTLFNESTSRQYVGLQSEHNMDANTQATIGGQFEDIVSSLTPALTELGIGEVGIESAARAALALGDINALTTNLRKTVGLEAFSSDTLSDYRSETILANGMAADKSSAIDVIYPIVEVGANYAGTVIELKRMVQVSNTEHSQSAALTKFTRRHLTDAYNDSTALIGDGNRLYPLVITGETEGSFVSSDLVPTTTVAGTNLRTAPLAIATTPVNMLGLASVSGAVGRNANTYNDRIDEGGRLSNLIFAFGAAPASGDPESRAALAVSLATINSAQFIRGAKVGSVTEVGSDMNITALPVNLSSTALSSNAKIVELRDLGYTRITLAVRVNTKLDLHSGDLSQTVSGVTISGVYNNATDENHIDDAATAAIVAAIPVSLEGFTPNVTMSSKTVRLSGTRIDDQSFQFTFNTTAQVPLTFEQEIQKDSLGGMLEVLTQADTVRREAQGVTKLIADITELSSTYGENSGPQDALDSALPCLAYLARPFIRKETLDINVIMDSLTSSSRAEDISGSIVPLIADFIADACSATNYVENKRIYNRDKDAKAEFAVLTSRQLGRYLTISGEDKTLGALSDVVEKPTLVTTGLSEMKETLIVVPVSTDNKGTFDVFGWGNTLRSPSIVYDVQLTDNGAKRFLQLQPFYEMTTNCPIAYMLTITGLSDALRTKNVFKTSDA